jgi:hypothetical protein
MVRTGDRVVMSRRYSCRILILHPSLHALHLPHPLLARALRFALGCVGLEQRLGMTLDSMGESV